jgi:hypothetical protein
MPSKKKPAVEIVPAPEAIVGPVPTELMIARLVKERSDEIMTSPGAEFEPAFQPREIAYEIQRRQTVFDRRKWALYFAKWGCQTCGRKDVSHFARAYCQTCHLLIRKRLEKIKIEFDRENPEREIAQQIDRITSRIRSANALFEESEPPHQPSPPETTAPSPDRTLAYRRRNLAAGKCAYCPRPLAPNSTHYCVECLGRKREGKRKRREEFKTRLRAVINPQEREK